VFDHDFSHLAEGIAIPHAIYAVTLIVIIFSRKNYQRIRGSAGSPDAAILNLGELLSDNAPHQEDLPGETMRPKGLAAKFDPADRVVENRSVVEKRQRV
jgi:hypothetical protein